MISEQDLKNFFNRIKPIEYLVMRNYYDLLNDINTGGDIDLLIDNVEEFIRCTDAQPLNNREKCYNYKVDIGGTWVPVDIRVAGDNYYDSSWEKDMLLRRVLYQESFYVMCEDDFFFSIVYHSLIHKTIIPSKYRSLFEQRGLVKDGELVKALSRFMKDDGYQYVMPIDQGVSFNKKNMRRLKLRLLFTKKATKSKCG